MSPLDKLIAQNEITQQIALFSLLVDGDGIDGKNTRAFADTIMAPDVISTVFLANGVMSGQKHGREEIVATTPPVPADKLTGGRHFMTSTYFDELTPSTAKTRTTALYLDVVKDLTPHSQRKPAAEPAPAPLMTAVTLVYHDVWIKTEDGWQKTHSTLRLDN